MGNETGAGIPHHRWTRIIPPAIIIYFIAYMDRLNVGFAIAGGMNQDLGLSLTMSGVAAGIFFIGYLVLQVPAGHIAEHGYAKLFILGSIVAWGGISIATGFVQTGWQLLVMRFLLGVAEGGVYPAVLIIIANWFPKRELARANAAFMLCLPLAAIFTNVVSGWLVSVSGWRSLFIIEGLISLALIFVWLPLISERPQEAKWLPAAEKTYLATTLREEEEERGRLFAAENQGRGVSYKDLIFSGPLWMMTLIYLCYNTGQYGFTMWLPSIVKALTKTSLGSVGLLSSPPFVVSLVGLLAFGILSDRSGNRRFYTWFSLAGFAVCLGLTGICGAAPWVAYFFLLISGFFDKSVQSPFWAMAPQLFPSGISGAARGVVNSFGNLGGFVGPTLVGWLTATTGSMMSGLFGLVGVLLIGTVLAMLLPTATAGKTAVATAVETSRNTV